MRLALALALALAVIPAIAAAQPSAPEPTGQPIESLQRDYDAAFAAMLAGDLTAAIAGFDAVAAAATGDLAASARELSRMARELSARRVRFVVGPVVQPGTPGPEAAAPIDGSVTAVSEDDQRNSGRISFVAWSTFAGLFTGISLIDIADVSDFRGGTLMVVGATGAGFAVSLLATSGRDVSSGMANSYSTGLLLGAGNGLLLASPLGLDTSEEVLGVGLAGMALGGGAGLLIADRARPTVGQSSFVSTTSFLGIATTGLSLAIIAPENIDGDTVLLILAGGLDAGAVAGMVWAPRLRWSKGRARLVQLGALLGGLAGLGIAAIITGDPENDSEARLLGASTLGGMWGGFGLTIKLTDDMAPDPRYATSSEPIALMPTMLGDAPGLVAGGRF